MVIRVLEVIDRCYSNEDGSVLLDHIKPFVIAGRPFSLSFKGVSAVSSSFVNSALIELLGSVSFDEIKRVVQITDVVPIVGRVIKERFAFEVERLGA